MKLVLAAISLGQNPVSQKYLAQKKKAAEAAGIGFRAFNFSKSVIKSRLENEIKRIGQNPTNSGIVIQLPLPLNHSTSQSLLGLIPPAKDPDYLTPENFGRFAQTASLIFPPVVSAIKKFFEKYKIKITGKNVVVVGAGRLVGLPVVIWLIQQGATVTVCHQYTRNLADFTKKAEVIISGAGRANLIKGSMIKKGVIVVDAGTSVDSGRVVGDVETQSVGKKAAFLAPVPGGVGPLAVACLLENLVELNRNYQQSRSSF